MRCPRHRSSISSCSWLPALTSISRSLPASATRMPEQTASPGEFYQLDFEMSFVTQEDVFKVGEEVLHDTFVKFAPEGSRITETPFPIISYKQAMLEFGCDKPDLRNPLRIMDVTEFFQRCTFKPFIGRTVRAIKVHAEMSKGFHEKLLSFATSLRNGWTWLSGSGRGYELQGTHR